jgi:putative peptide zinc metalloprotease protein
VHPTRHRYRGQAWYVLHDGLTGQAHRLSPAAYLFVARMDGRRSIDELWSATVKTLEEDAPTQDEALHLFGQLHAADTLTCDVPPDVAELIERNARYRHSRLKQTLLSPMFIRVPLFDPDRFLARTLVWVRPLFGWLGILLWIAAVVPALLLALVHWADLTQNLSDRMLAADNLLLMSLVYPVVKALHELGHGYASKAFGGGVHETGVMFMMGVPTPYVDASAATAFRNKYHRILVGAAGMLVELFLAAIALYVWLMVEPGLLRAIAFNVMVIAGVSTIVFNGNPLMRYDGYYMLVDLIEMPNLAARANRYWGHLVDKYAFGAKDLEAPPLQPGERLWLVAYAPASFIYRLIVQLGIALYLAGTYLIVGVVLALWTLASGVLVPLWKGLAHVATSPRLSGHRLRAVALTGGLTAAVLALMLFIPLPLHTVSEGVVWLPESAILRAGTDGFVERVLLAPGSAVAAGAPVVESDEPELRARLRVDRAHVTELESQLATQQFTDLAEAEITRVELAQARAELALATERADRLLARSAADGTLAVAKVDDLPGRFLREGDVIGYVLPAASNVVRVTVPQDDIALVRQHVRRVEVKLADALGASYDAVVSREVPAGRNDLPSKALGAGGGGTAAVDPRDNEGRRTLQRVFQLDLVLSADIPGETFGGRAYVRFDHDWEPLAAQLYRRVRQLLLSRLSA